MLLKRRHKKQFMKPGELLRFSLVGYRIHFCFKSSLITKVIVTQNIHVIVEFINQRYAGWNIQFEDFVVAHVVEIFYQSTQGVAVGSDNYVFSIFDIGFDDFLVVRNNAVNCCF